MELSLGAMSKIVSTAGAVVSAVSQMQESAYQQAVAQRNQQIADENRQRAIEESQIEQRDWSEAAREQLGALIADISASGVATHGGTASLLRTGTRRLAQRDASRIREEGDARARAAGQQSADFAGQASAARSSRAFNLFGGALDVTSSYIDAATRNRRRNALLEESRP